LSTTDPNAVLWKLVRGATATKALGVAADLGIADALADGPRGVDELAAEIGAEPDTLNRILRALASDGVFAEEKPRLFRNTDASELLRRNSPGSWREFAHLFAGVFYTAIGELDPSTTKPTFSRRFGNDFWPWLASNPAERATFDAAMAGGKERSAERLAALTWQGDETVVDVGGGNGALLIALIERQPGLSGVVFDLPETDRDEASLGDRITFVAGSFFETVPRGDVYVLSGILHDWDDERAGAILTSIRAAAPSRARLLVIDSVIEPGNKPDGAKWLDLLMLVLESGRERTEPEWRALLEGGGFTIDHVEDGLIQARCP
jgi:O-methyltransferase/methyltransferase family protein